VLPAAEQEHEPRRVGGPKRQGTCGHGQGHRRAMGRQKPEHEAQYEETKEDLFPKRTSRAGGECRPEARWMQRFRERAGEGRLYGGNGKGTERASAGKDGSSKGTVNAAASANAAERTRADFRSWRRGTTAPFRIEPGRLDARRVICGWSAVLAGPLHRD
jgi:hypothetical protein